MNKGSLIYEDYYDLVNNNILLSKNFNKNQIQPSSIDLTLSGECYEISSSFLSHTTKVRDKLNKYIYGQKLEELEYVEERVEIIPGHIPITYNQKVASII